MSVPLTAFVFLTAMKYISLPYCPAAQLCFTSLPPFYLSSLSLPFFSPTVLTPFMVVSHPQGCESDNFDPDLDPTFHFNAAPDPTVWSSKAQVYLKYILYNTGGVCAVVVFSYRLMSIVRSLKNV